MRRHCFKQGFHQSVIRLAMTKMQAAVSSPSMMVVNLSFQRSGRLLASTQKSWARRHPQQPL